MEAALLANFCLEETIARCSTLSAGAKDSLLPSFFSSSLSLTNPFFVSFHPSSHPPTFFLTSVISYFFLCTFLSLILQTMFRCYNKDSDLGMKSSRKLL
jgi:hypothetical protein